MPRKPKDFEYLSIKLDRKISERLTAYCEMESRTKTAAVERILREYLDNYEKKQNNKD